MPTVIPTKLTFLSKKQTQEKPLVLPSSYIPTEVDVCSGRGKTHEKHQGNIWFRCLIKENSEKYRTGRTKTAKTKVVVAIVQHVRAQGGKFLKQTVNEDLWYDMGDKDARRKVGHALRDFVSKTDDQAENLTLGRSQSLSALHRQRNRTAAVAQEKGQPLPDVVYTNAEEAAMTSIIFEPLDYRRSSSAPALGFSEASALSDLVKLPEHLFTFELEADKILSQYEL